MKNFEFTPAIRSGSDVFVKGDYILCRALGAPFCGEILGITRNSIRIEGLPGESRGKSGLIETGDIESMRFADRAAACL